MSGLFFVFMVMAMPTTSKIRVAIFGATAYTSRNRIRSLGGHPQAEITAMCSRRDPQPLIEDIFPEFAGRVQIKCESIDPAALKGRADVAMLCLPNGVAMSFAP